MAAIAVAMGCRQADRAGRQDDTAGVALRVDSSAAAARTCGVNVLPSLSEDGIGALQPGRPVSDVKMLCDVLSDSDQRSAEGMIERVIVVRIAGEIVRATVVNGKLWRIELSSPLFSTADSLGVDAPLLRMASKPGAQFAPGEDGVYAFVPDHCGLSFRFSLPLRPPAGGQWTATSIGAAHPDATVDRVLVARCGR